MLVMDSSPSSRRLDAQPTLVLQWRDMVSDTRLNVNAGTSVAFQKVVEFLRRLEFPRTDTRRARETQSGDEGPNLTGQTLLL